MPTEQQILEILNRFTTPGSKTGLVDDGAVRNIEVEGTTIRVAMAVPAGHPGPIDELRKGLTQALMSLDGIDSADVQIQTMLSTIPLGFTMFWIGDWAGAMARLSRENPKRDPCSSRTPTTR